MPLNHLDDVILLMDFRKVTLLKITYGRLPMKWVAKRIYTDAIINQTYLISKIKLGPKI
jgi:hypothetical protein